MKQLKILDVTLRDGGCVNDFNFGNAYIERILNAEENAGIDIIELGYIDRNGSETGRTKFLSEKVIECSILHEKKKNVSYVAMIDYGKYDISQLEERSKTGIDGIRLAFHKKDMLHVIELGRQIINKGYELYIQPMITLRYSDEELLQLIHLVNLELHGATAFYIVDSFGEMRTNDVGRIFSLVDHNLSKNIAIGFHSHNNIQMSYSNAIHMLQLESNRDLIIDCSIMGMGKGAGNLNTEIFVEHLNRYYQKKYSVQPLLEVIDKVINLIHAEYYWGYAPEYYLSSINHCTPSYASYFYDKQMLPIDQVSELLGLLPEDKKISFDRIYAENLYRNYNAKKAVNDNSVVEELKKEFDEKNVVLIAPGKSIVEEKEKIDEYLTDSENYLLLGLNVLDYFQFDYVVTTRKEVYEQAMNDNKNIIVTSNISKGGRGNVKVLDYSKWINIEDNTYDSSLVIILNLLKTCNINKIALAGFDGFSLDINENYYNMEMRHLITAKQVENRNSYYKKIISEVIASGVHVEFITKSKYQND